MLGQPTHRLVRDGLGYVPEDRCVFTGLTVAENLRLAEPRTGKPAYDRVYELDRRGRQRAGSLSGGQQQMLEIGRVLLGDNRLLLVDEPTKGLAPKVVTEVTEVLERVARSVPVLLVEQNLAVVRRLARDAVVLAAGRVAWTGDARELLAEAALTRSLLGVGAHSPEVPAPPAATPAELAPRRRGLVRPWLPLVALAVFAILPYSTVNLPGVFDGPLNAPGTLQLLAITGGTVLAGLLGAVALRTVGIAFAMVTLAFAQVGAILVAHDYSGLTGGEEGLPLDVSGLPAGLVGVANTVNLYWLALAYLALVVFVAHRVAASPTGRVLAGLRDDERRVSVLGLDPYRFKLLAFTLAGGLAAGGGVVYCLLVGGASPHITSSELTLSLLVMVVLGGPGTRWGRCWAGCSTRTSTTG